LFDLTMPIEPFELIDPGLDIEFFQQRFCKLIGIPESIPVALVIQEIIGGLILFTPENQEPINYVLAFVAAQKPASLLEAQLIVQMLATHRLYTQMIKEAGEKRMLAEETEKYVNIASKLSRGCKNVLEALTKHRLEVKKCLYSEQIYLQKQTQAVIDHATRGND
jgi:hypothetical protein